MPSTPRSLTQHILTCVPQDTCTRMFKGEVPNRTIKISIEEEGVSSVHGYLSGLLYSTAKE